MNDLEDWYDRYAPMVFRRCVQLLHNEDDALDAMQEVFVRVIRHRGVIQDPGAFLYRAATNTCLNYLRASRRHRDKLENKALVALVSLYDERAALMSRSLLRRLFARNTESTFHIAVLYYVDGLTLEQVALDVGLSVSGVRKRLRKLRAQLELLQQEPLP